MKLLKNREVIISVLLYLIFSLAAVLAAFVWDFTFGIFTSLLCVIFISTFLISTYFRYRKIAELSEDINKILHGNNHISLKAYSEGELSLLQSEIYKMTVRLREQQQKLLDDKIYLADSIADISHQIRTPLTSINLLASLINEPDISQERRLKLSHELYGLLSRIEWLITVLLKISKLDTGTVQFNKEKISLQNLIDKAVNPLLVPVELRGQSLIINAQGMFYGDISWTVEAIGNIIKNCMEHTPDKGEIKIYASENVLYSEITVTDTGPGISKEDLPHIFERFYKGKGSDESSFGIGLALSRMIIISQNGTIKAENAASGGALFTMRFYKEIV